ncbi:MAG: NAD(P)/FAD-dependent oxidoreductase [Anaerolineae bacterium]|jgi:putative flavoprotein involved in K+ transport|nr:NAD(P)/FAD-dependent oxidoreductase [Anaerolineae bacterium]
MTETVLVIGAGPAGLASAYFLQQAGIPYQVVDCSEVIASTWHNLYPSLKLNTTRFLSHLPGRKFPLTYGIFPTGKQYHRYLVQYAQDHHFNLQLGVEVQRIQPENGGWRVESTLGSTWHPAVISASGRFHRPYLAQISGMDHFDGTIIHANDYKGPTPFIGQRVMVIGNGPSGVDISIEIGKHNAIPTLLAMRTGILLRPRFPLGLPKHVWMLIAERMPKPIGDRIDRMIESIRFQNLDRIGIKSVPEARLSSAASTRGPELIHAVKRGIVKCIDAPIRLEQHAAILPDDQRIEVDTIILATGYRPVLYRYFGYQGPVDSYGWPLRDLEAHPNGREVLGYPGLYLVGVFYQGKGAMYNFNIEAAIAVEQLQKRLVRA